MNLSNWARIRPLSQQWLRHTQAVRKLSTFEASEKTISDVYRLHHVPTTPITLKSLYELGPSPISIDSLSWNQWLAENEPKVIESVQFLHREVPIRLARRIVDLESLPDSLVENPHILQLRNLLLESFEQMYNFPMPKNMEQEREYMRLQMSIRERHSGMHDHMTEALAEWEGESSAELDAILDRFYKSRITLRMIIDQHIAVQKNHPGSHGIIAEACSPVQVIRQVVPKVQKWCAARYGVSPQVKIQGGAEVLFKYIPSHIEVVSAELLKYSMQRVALKFRGKMHPDIEVRVAGGQKGVTIKVSDQGGGIPFTDIPSLWSYVSRSRYFAAEYDPISSPLDKRVDVDDSVQTDLAQASHQSQSHIGLSGGFGLPIARLYARYFGGDLNIMPMEGYGTDAYVHLDKLSEEQKLH